VSSEHSNRRSGEDQRLDVGQKGLGGLYVDLRCRRCWEVIYRENNCQEEKILLASFFFFRSDPLRNNFKRFIPTLAYDIIQSVPDCRSIIERVVESDPHIFHRSLDAQIHHLILSPLSQVAQTRAIAGHPLPYVIIIDGLDECIETQEQTSIIQLFSKTLCQNPHFRWKVLIASRPELAIRHSFNNVMNPSTSLALSDDYTADEDIRRYLEDNFREIKRKNPNKSHLPSDWPSKEDIDSLVRKSSGQFIYAATVIKFLSSGKRIKARLRIILDFGSTLINGQTELPFCQLDALYEHILNSAGAGQVEAVKQTTALCILYKSCYFRYALPDQTPGEIIAGVLALEIEDVDCILEERSPILKAAGDDIRLYHASISDFLFDRNRAGGLWVDERFLWSKIVCYSLQSLRTIPKRSPWQWGLITTLTKALRQARPTEEVTQCLSSDFTPLFDLEYRFFESWIAFFDSFRELALVRYSILIREWRSWKFVSQTDLDV